MKKITCIVASLFISYVAIYSQTINVHFKNGQTIEFSSNNVDYVDFSEKPRESTLTEGEAIDLGLSVLWASCNLGATKPEEAGNMYSWGEVKPKEKYSKSNYSFYDESTQKYTYIGVNIAGTEFDAATVNIGNDWSIPTAAQLQELIDNCTWEWTKINNEFGFRIIGKNGNSIFIPHISDFAWYWTSTMHNTDEGFAKCLLQVSTSHWISAQRRENGNFYRPVKKIK